MGEGPDLTRPQTFVNKMSVGTFLALILAATIIFVIWRLGMFTEGVLVNLWSRGTRHLTGAMTNAGNANDPLAEAA